MDRRQFSKGITAAVTAAACTHQAFAQNKPPEEGVDYVALDKPVPTEAKGKIEVLEFFWYSCPHCNNFEPSFEAWVKKAPKDVVVRRVPVAFRDDFVPQQRLFYALEALGKLEALHKKVFYAIHGEKQTLNDQDQIAAWVEKQGINKEQFLAQYNSFAMNGKTARARQLQQQYRVGGVPALGIGGRYYTDGSLAQSMGRALQVTDHLIGKLRTA
jgi:protein dithiol oxidoreductase (disulfide-forming)